jgi:hypothetical protein
MQLTLQNPTGRWSLTHHRPACVRSAAFLGRPMLLPVWILLTLQSLADAATPPVVPPAAGDVDGDIRGLKELAEIPNPWLWLWGALGLIVAGLGLFWVWRLRRRRAALSPPDVIVPPHVRARQALLRALDFLFDPDHCCVLLSGAIRLYLEERFRLRAPERTTEEFLRELQIAPVLTTEQKASLEEFLQRCDLAKFARHPATEAELREIYDVALRLVEETSPAVAASDAGRTEPAAAAAR